MNKEIERVFARQRSHQHVVRATTAEQRIAKLERLKAALTASLPEFFAALGRDSGKPPMEAFIEMSGAVGELDHAIANLEAWMEPETVSTGPYSRPGVVAQIVYQPKGQVLLFGPWNFPAGLVFQPLVGVIAAGNVCMIKPSELTPAASALTKKVIAEVFPEEEVAVFEGGPEVAEQLLALPFDHIFFTGSTKVGKLVMAAAAKHLATVTLELGGKSPAIVADKVDLQRAADRISYGKFANAGQVCLAPDHVYVPARQRDDFVRYVKAYLDKAYSSEGSFATNDFAQIINSRNLERLSHLLNDAVSKGARVIHGGAVVGERRLGPTIIIDVPPDAEMMQEEIFGPIMPVLAYERIDDVIDAVNARAKPLALYLFSDDETFTARVLDRTSSGGATVNDVFRHVTEATLPFGGAGPSGHGAYHGKYTFTAFSHARSVYFQAAGDNPGETLTRAPFKGKLEALLGQSAATS